MTQDQFFLILDNIGRVFTVWSLLLFVIWAISTALAVFAFVFLFLRKERRLVSNLQKRIAFINLTGDNALIESEVESISRNGLFKNPDVWSDARCNTFLTDHSVVIIAITDSTDVETFRSVYEKAKELSKPVIIYTAGNRQTSFINDNRTLIYSYAFHSIATTPLRLMADIFATLSTFPK